ncbi:membrane protein DedA, SNARE-associated domain [Pseudonocardia thermophila]|uniref:Membrane protein DedA, SNARE-associated domain n=1 Tax=Pseudonocardia thermophila TaxID=1848 RepID=A0A1M6ZWV0_PSETH|nr:membrane protein DedA, SNARE-associated domain [Pseudonocardia thermophila]
MVEGLRQLIEGALSSPWLLLVILGLAVIDALLPAVPSEALIIGGGVAAASGSQELVLVVAAAAAGSFVGESIAYFIGRRLGPAVRRRMVPGTTRATTYAHVEHLLHTRGGLILLTGRFIPAGRTVAALAAGATGLAGRRFAFFTAPGTVLSAGWSALLGFLGGAAVAGDPLIALLVGMAAGTVVTTAIGLARRGRPGAPGAEPETTAPVPVGTRS